MANAHIRHRLDELVLQLIQVPGLRHDRDFDRPVAVAVDHPEGCPISFRHGPWSSSSEAQSLVSRLSAPSWTAVDSGGTETKTETARALHPVPHGFKYFEGRA